MEKRVINGVNPVSDVKKIANKKCDEYGDYPSLENIQKDYDELLQLVGSIVTVEQVKEFQKSHTNVTIEINGMSVDEFEEGLVLLGGTRAVSRKSNNDIDWIRYECYGCLSYIYFHIKSGVITSIIFDVWSNKWDNEFIENVTMDNVVSDYDKYVAYAEKCWEEYAG